MIFDTALVAIDCRSRLANKYDGFLLIGLHNGDPDC
jgi:hypothetical protein